jgi:hypothetical protein
MLKVNPQISPKLSRNKILIGLLTGRRKEAVSAMNVQANMNGSGGKRKRVTMANTTGVRMRKVASLDKKVVISIPTRNTPSNNRRALPPASDPSWQQGYQKSQLCRQQLKWSSVPGRSHIFH